VQLGGVAVVDGEAAEPCAAADGRRRVGSREIAAIGVAAAAELGRSAAGRVTKVLSKSEQASL
jgi:hypothetical protein